MLPSEYLRDRETDMNDGSSVRLRCGVRKNGMAAFTRAIKLMGEREPVDGDGERAGRRRARAQSSPMVRGSREHTP